MATEVVKVVDPDNGSGTNYTSLAAWEAGEQGNLTGARDEIAVAKCRCTGGTADGAVEFAGWTTDSTRYIKIWTDTSESYRHNGTWQTGNKYRIVSNNYFATVWNNNNARLDLWLDGLQIDNNREYGSADGASAAGVYSYQDYAFNLTVSNCVIRSSATSHYPVASGITVHNAATSGTTSFKAYNNIVYGYSGTSDASGIRWSKSGSGSTDTVVVYNNTCCYNHYNFSLSPNWTSDTIYFVVKNNIGSDYTTSGADYYRSDSAGTWTTSKNISSDTSSWDSSYRSKTVVFVNESSRDFHLSSSDTEARGNGDNLSSDSYCPFSTDIDGQSRGSTWDIGADQYVAAGGAYPFQVKRRLNVLLRMCLLIFNLIWRCFK